MVSFVGLKAKLLRGGGGSVLVKMASIAVTLGGAVFLARAMGAGKYGEYAFVIAAITILGIPSKLGVPKLVMRETARYTAEEKWGLLKGLWSWAAMFALGSSAVVGIGVLAFLKFIKNDTSLGSMSLGLVLLPVLALSYIRAEILSGMGAVVLGQLPERVITPLFLLVGVAGISLFFENITAEIAVAVHIGAAMVGFSVGAYLLRKNFPASQLNGIKREYMSGKWLKAAVPLGALSGITILNQNAGTLILGAVSSLEEVAVYKIVVTGGLLTLFTLQSVNAVIAPYLVKANVTNDLRRFQQLCGFGSFFVFVIGLPVNLLFLFFATSILAGVFGPEFVVGADALVIVSLGLLVQSFFGTAQVALNMVDMERISFGIALMCAIVNVALAALLVPLFGLEGAATAFAIASALAGIAMHYQAKKQMNINCSAAYPVVKWLSEARAGTRA